MIIVLIERQIAEDMEPTYEASAKRTLHLAYQAPGFINGETFIDINNSRRRFVLSKWQSSRDWFAWYSSDERKAMMNELNLLLEQQEKISLLQN
ncbi:MAG: antibiotic biosynthesis monooxygenase [Gammaproteobacteria bacterium]|uniref:antibiotic biosynthesis monooxygenase family protein n=1 Tax=Pseudomaricurvus alcaniphilus TaxID=1166482 RepID=UPI0014080929|nr:antibiotic biosynthesis monooxygenase [Pseudomaricurvus alcaniphilus]MBR9912504.1 antibiotic biosynthesis monooxygenase [Gammaproteobacteria bacterium]NHN36285.1 antibiotic biosynthesis monooxygenase [Pseudomaricurvus alcaniphilus]